MIRARNGFPWGVLLLVSCVLGLGVRGVKSIQFEQEVGGHLELASSANQVPLAISELEQAIKGLDDRGVTQERLQGDCYTSVIYRTPDENVCFWRTNLEQTVADLKAIPEAADHLTVSNTLLKVRETLTRAGEKGESVVCPDGISIYGSNTLYFWFLLLTFLIGLARSSFEIDLR